MSRKSCSTAKNTNSNASCKSIKPFLKKICLFCNPKNSDTTIRDSQTISEELVHANDYIIENQVIKKVPITSFATTKDLEEYSQLVKTDKDEMKFLGNCKSINCKKSNHSEQVYHMHSKKHIWSESESSNSIQSRNYEPSEESVRKRGKTRLQNLFRKFEIEDKNKKVPFQSHQYEAKVTTQSISPKTTMAPPRTTIPIIHPNFLDQYSTIFVDTTKPSVPKDPSPLNPSNRYVPKPLKIPLKWIKKGLIVKEDIAVPTHPSITSFNPHDEPSTSRDVQRWRINNPKYHLYKDLHDYTSNNPLNAKNNNSERPSGTRKSNGNRRFDLKQNDSDIVMYQVDSKNKSELQELKSGKKLLKWKIVINHTQPKINDIATSTSSFSKNYSRR